MEDPEQHLVAFDASRPNQTTAYRIVMKGIGTVPCNIWNIYAHRFSEVTSNSNLQSVCKPMIVYYMEHI
jgi:hypothetical protein